MGKMFPRLIRLSLGFAGGALAAFHGWVFAAQAAEGRLEDPWLILRWVASVSLILALATLKRSGESIWGRKGIAIWVLAALLHGPAVAGNNDIASIALPENVVTSVLQLVSSAGLGLGLWMLARLMRSRARTVSFDSVVQPFVAAAHLAARTTPQFSPRPPPVRA
jgi:hypothetical protein